MNSSKELFTFIMKKAHPVGVSDLHRPPFLFPSLFLFMFLFLPLFLLLPFTGKAQPVITGAERMNIYLPLLKNKRVAVFANQTSRVGTSHLVDTLLHRGVQIRKIFGPEHGFRGTADAGAHVNSSTDAATGLPIISLYGSHKKPTAEDLKNIDVLVFDIQDVGVRFYTFISSLEYCLEACLENRKGFLLLDRPNPNGFYVDGPVLDPAFKSFVGMQPVPVVYGMTLGEYTLMLLGEQWLNNNCNRINEYNIRTTPTADTPFHVQVIKCQNYTHQTLYKLPVPPSPNLKDMQSVYLYPSTCFFEGTVLSEGRGTDFPFQQFGHPTLSRDLHSFRPEPRPGAVSSKCYGQTCYGWFEGGSVESVLKKVNNQVNPAYLVRAYSAFPGKDSFFLKNGFIHKLAGSDQLMKQVQQGKPAVEIHAGWQPAVNRFKQVRKKYLLYPDHTP